MSKDLSISQRILQYAHDHEGKITTKEAVQAFQNLYYHNGRHYISEALTKLVKSGVLLRESQGNYTVNPRPRMMQRGKLTLPNDDQQTLF